MGATPVPGTPAAAPNAARVRLTKWIAKRVPAPLLYRILIRRSPLPSLPIFRAALAAGTRQQREQLRTLLAPAS